jgi:hypothetical protein
MKIMATHSSATPREFRTDSIINALKRRAQAVLNDRSIDPQTRTLIRYAFETDDPWLAELVRRAEAGESIVDAIDFSQTPENIEAQQDIETLAEIICRAGDQSGAALLLLMARLEKSTQPKALANAAKHFAFARCAELNLYGMIDAQIAMLEGELLASYVEILD